MNVSTKLLYIFLLLAAPVLSYAQPSKIKFRDRLGDSTQLVNTAVKPPKVKGPKAISGELSGGIRLNTDGYGIFVDKGWLKGGETFGTQNRDLLYHVALLQVELQERKHPKEIASNQLLGPGGQATNYILGKINNFYTLKVGYGRRQMIAGKPDPGTFSVHWVYLGGFAGGLVKPYYLMLNRGYGEQKYNDTIAQVFVSPGYIDGKSGFTKGLNELKFVPGVHGKTGLHVDFSAGRKAVAALETGVNVEYYFSKIEQMVAQKPQNAFLNFYASLQFGIRR